jgi:hypothetical protein
LGHKILASIFGLLTLPLGSFLFVEEILRRRIVGFNVARQGTLGRWQVVHVFSAFFLVRFLAPQVIEFNVKFVGRLFCL